MFLLSVTLRLPKEVHPASSTCRDGHIEAHSIFEPVRVSMASFRPFLSTPGIVIDREKWVAGICGLSGAEGFDLLS